MIVLDTAALLFWTMAPDRLSATAASAIAEADRIIVSAISIWEIGIKLKRGSLALPLSLREYTAMLRETERVEIVPVDETIWIGSIELAWEHRDPADRTIVATAQALGCPLVTSDGPIRAFYPAAVW